MMLTLSHSLGMICAGSAAWLMVRSASAKGLLRVKVERRCASCGRRLVRGACPCSHDAP